MRTNPVFLCRSMVCCPLLATTEFNLALLITVRKIAEIVPGCNVKDRDYRGKKGQTSASRVGRGRTDPYQAPYFFPSPVSPWAYDYVRLIQLNRKLDLSSDVPTSHSPLTSSGDDQARVSSPSGRNARIVRAPSHQRSASH
jgi:hypothetical protein